MPNTSIPIATANSPALAAKDLSRVVNNSSLMGSYIPNNMALAKQYFPTVDSLGLGTLLNLDKSTIFPFKDNSLAITDIEVPTTILVLSKGSGQIQLQTNRFILQSISKPSQERFQIIETFGDPAVYFYGDRTKVYTLQGLLVDAEDPLQVNNTGTGTPEQQRSKGKYYWATAFQDLYENHLRGTILTQRSQIAAIYVNNWFIKGYPVQLVINKESANTPQLASFQMTWVIEKESLLSATNAEWLYRNNTLKGEAAQALNAYLDALVKYDDAYLAWQKESKGVPDVTPLSQAKDRAASAVKTALKNLESAIVKEALINKK